MPKRLGVWSRQHRAACRSAATSFSELVNAMSRSSPFSYFFFHSATSFRSSRSSALCSSMVAISSLSAAVLEPGLLSFVMSSVLHVRARRSGEAAGRLPRTVSRFPPPPMAAVPRARPWCRGSFHNRSLTFLLHDVHHALTHSLAPARAQRSALLKISEVTVDRRDDLGDSLLLRRDRAENRRRPLRRILAAAASRATRAGLMRFRSTPWCAGMLPNETPFRSPSISSTSLRSRSAPGRSALLTTKMSATSITPALSV